VADDLEYEPVFPKGRAELLNEFRSPDPEVVAEARFSATYHDADWRWVQEWCLRFLNRSTFEFDGQRLGCANTWKNPARNWVSEPDDHFVFISNAGEPFAVDYLTELVSMYVKAAQINKQGSHVPAHHGDVDA
jgi:hypothetical protein